MENENVGNKKFLFGLFLILIGVLWIFIKLDLIPAFWSDILISWEMLLIGIGVLSLIGGNITAGTILVVIGGFFIIPDIIHVPFGLRRIGWPIFLIGIGLVLLLTNRKNRHPSLPKAGMKGLDSFDDFVIFGGREIFINSLNFFGGKILVLFGGAEYDMRTVNLSKDGAVIDCVCIFGGCGFKLPPDWTIKNEVNAIFGGFSDKRGMPAHDTGSDPSKRLVIRGFCAFGGIEVKYK